ncbi:MAG: DUF4838 domain-containing protein [Armatimonadota bacterium]
MIAHPEAVAVVLIALALLVPAAPMVAQGDAFPAVLTDNAADDEPAIPTGVTYEADPPYANPADESGRRLLDRDRPWDDWNVTVGINEPAQTVIFDFKREYRFSRFSVRMVHERKPASIGVAVASAEDGPWREVGQIVPAEAEADERGWFSLSADEPATGRYVRLLFRLQGWGWYVKEVKFWGVRADEPGPDSPVPLLTDGRRLVIAREGRPAASIIVAAGAPPEIVSSARFLQTTIHRMTGATLPMRDDSRDWEGGHILVGPSRLNELRVQQGLDAPQRYRLEVEGDSMSLAGNDAGPLHGTRNAVFALLWELGCGWFGPDELYHVIPETDELSIAPMTRDEQPDFDFRRVWNVFPEADGAWRLGGPRVNSGHAYSRIIPPDEYFEQHPEYFALVDGERRAERAQICFANPDVQRITVEKARRYFDENPDALTFSLSANDCGGFCQCAQCAEMGENPGARSLAFANIVARQLAETHPDKMVCFLAYWYTSAAPSEMQAEPNVMVMVVNQACHAHAVDDPTCPHNVGWRENFEKWCATGAKMAIYEWYIPGCKQTHWRSLPWISTDVAFANLRYWRSKGVRWVTYESQPAYEEGTGYPRRWPLYYLAARGLWDCDADPREVLSEACRRLYGPAAEAMTRYFQTMAEAMEATRLHSSIWNLPQAQAVYRPDVRDEVRSLLGEALIAAATAPRAWARVAREAELWRESEEALAELPELTQHPVDARKYNGGVWFTDQAQVTGSLLRELVGIGAGEDLLVVVGDRPLPLEDDRTYDATGGLRIVPAGEQ